VHVIDPAPSNCLDLYPGTGVAISRSSVTLGGQPARRIVTDPNRNTATEVGWSVVVNAHYGGRCYQLQFFAWTAATRQANLSVIDSMLASFRFVG